MEYPEREFCNFMNCKFFKNIGVNEVLKIKCKKKCPFTAWQFFSFLKEKGYKLLKVLETSDIFQ